MTARLRKLITKLADTFWLLPALMTIAAFLLAVGLVQVDREDIISKSMLAGPWLYNGSATGARTLLGAIASSTIGVASTVFSITIAALSLAAGQMGPRLLRNFVRDRGNQLTLGIFLGSFAYALMVLRSVRTQAEGEFVPHLALSVAIAAALICVFTLILFVGHMAGRINVDTVIELVSNDLRAAIRRFTTKDAQPEPPSEEFWKEAFVIRDPRHGYLQQLDVEGLANWAAERGTSIRLLVRPGHYVFPDAPIALLTKSVDGAHEAIREATALDSKRSTTADLEFDLRQLIEVAVRALSSGINDPHTAISVLDRLGTALCELVSLNLFNGVTERNDVPVLVIPRIDYQGLTDAMFHMIRQNAASQPAVLIRMLEVLIAVVLCEADKERVGILHHHADLVLHDATVHIETPEDLNDVWTRYGRFLDIAAGKLTS